MAEVTQSQFDLARIRQSQEDLKRIMGALEADGTLTVVADPPPEEPEVDEEGNEVPGQLPAATTDAIAITVDNVAEEEEEEEE